MSICEDQGPCALTSTIINGAFAPSAFYFALLIKIHFHLGWNKTIPDKQNLRPHPRIFVKIRVLLIGGK
jgi:hypothetical protein